MGGPVHEGLATHNRSAPITRRSLPAIGVEGVGEVARLTVHVHILTIETRSAFIQSFGQHRSNLRQQFTHRGGAKPLCGSEVVQLGSPERLIGVNVANTANQVLIEKSPLHLGVLSP